MLCKNGNKTRYSTRQVNLFPGVGIRVKTAIIMTLSSLRAGVVFIT